MISNSVKYIFISFLSIVRGQGIINIYAELNTDVVLKCPLRDSVSDSFGLIWFGPPYSSEGFGTTYFSSRDDVNPNTPVGNRLSVVGDQSAGEYNMKISNLQQSDTGIYSCVYGNNVTTFSLQLIVPVETVTVNPQTIQVIEGNLTKVNCTTSDSVPPANVTWYIRRQGIPAPVELTSGITNIYYNKKTISTLTFTGRKQDNSGYLYCNASNDRNREIKSQNIPVSVLYKPSTIRISPVYNTYTVYVNQSGVELNCSAEDANPLFITYKWSHDGVTTMNNPYVITVGKNSGGTYTCVASNRAGTISTSRIVTVQYDPEVQPFIKQQPVEGRTFVLSCNVSGNPAPNISEQIWWTRRNDSTFRQQGNQLVIDNIQKGYSDTYTCHAQNTLTPSGQSSIIKTASQNVEVDVLYKPVLTTSPNYTPLILYVEQQNVQFTCNSPQANPSSVTYWWTNNNQNYTNPVFTLSPVTKTSGGDYICNGRNSVGTSSSTVSVVIQYGPSINPISSQTFIAGRFASVNCNVTSYPEAYITWTGPNSLQQTGRALVFTTVSKSQKGIYTCTAANTLTPSGQREIQKQQQINVDVDILYKPEVNDIPSPSIVEGGILNITCSAVANPPVHIYKWTKIGDITFQQSSETLVITNIRRTQSGKYRCTAMNTMSPTNGQQETGEGHREVTINVKYPPEIRDLDLVGSGMERSEGEMISFKCVIDSYPKSDVTWISKSGNSRPMYIDNKKQISYFNITITCADTGLYQCSAFNNLGTTAINETRLFVKCSPRLDNRIPQTDINRVALDAGDKINISAQYLAYPSATVIWSKFNYTSLTNEVINASNLGYKIENRYFIFWQKSMLTKANITQKDFGTIIVTFDNGISSSSSRFIIEAKGMSRFTNDSSVSVILGSILAVVVVLAVFIIVFISCRKQGQRCKQNRKEGSKSNIDYRASSEESQPYNADSNVYECIVSDNGQANIENSHSNTYETLTANGISTNHNVYSTLRETGANDIQLEHIYLNTTLKTGKTNK